MTSDRVREIAYADDLSFELDQTIPRLQELRRALQRKGPERTFKSWAFPASMLIDGLPEVRQSAEDIIEALED
jgi:hypothetical protein